MSSMLSPAFMPPPPPKIKPLFKDDDEDEEVDIGEGEGGPDDRFVPLEPSSLRTFTANPRRVLNLGCTGRGYGAESYFPHQGVGLYMHSVDVMNASLETPEKSVGPRIIKATAYTDPALDQKVTSVKVLADFVNKHFSETGVDRKFEDVVAIVVSHDEAQDWADAEKNYIAHGVDPATHWSRPFFDWLRTVVVISLEHGRWFALKMTEPAIKKAIFNINQANAGLPPAAAAKRPAPDAPPPPPPPASSSSSSAAASAPAPSPPPPPSIPSEPAAKKGRKPAAPAPAPSSAPVEPLIVRAIKALKDYHAEAGQASLDSFYALASSTERLPPSRIAAVRSILETFSEEQTDKYYNTPFSTPGSVVGGGHMILGLKNVLGTSFEALPFTVKCIVHVPFVVPPELAAISPTDAPSLKTFATIYNAVMHLPLKYAEGLM